MTSTGERIEDFTFAEVQKRYPWEEWTDGSTWKIRKGEHYEIKTSNMQTSLHMRARAKYLKVQTHKFSSDGDEGLIFQFIPMTAHEIDQAKAEAAAKKLLKEQDQAQV